MKGFAHAHDGAVHRAEDHMVRKAGCGFQKLQDPFRVNDQ